MTRELLFVRLALAAVPLAATATSLAIRRPPRRVMTGVLLAVAWNAWALLLVNAVAVHLGWWRFGPSLPELMGVAIEPWLGWVLLWGALVPIVALDRPLVPTLVALLWFDLIAMPLLEPALQLGSSWLVGEGAALLVALVPSFLLARWIAADTHLSKRATLQVVCAAGLFLWLVPSLALSRTGGWERVASLPAWRLNLGTQALLVPAALGLAAVGEFVRRGKGTPIPYDPPRNLVTSGPYSYVANPMQLSMVVTFVVLAVTLWNPWLFVAAVMAFVYGAGLAQWHENVDLATRFGSDWTGYRTHVRTWVPRRRPHVTDESSLLVAYSCSTCSSVGRWFLARDPIGLKIEPAEDASDRGIRRITYVPATGPPSRGVVAVAHALEHLHLGWATVGWLLSLPGVRHLAQLVTDVCGPTPGAVVGGLPYDRDACRTAGRGRPVA